MFSIKQQTTPICTVIIPAYNEASVIGNTLKALTADMLEDEFDIIVVCNGCKDQTATIAKQHTPFANVIEQKQAGKSAALNTGIQEANHTPFVFLDADIITDAKAVRMLVHRLAWSSALMSYGKAQFDTQASNILVRQFYAVWQQNPYFDRHKVGGFFAVSDAGMRSMVQFPDAINDDEFIRRHFFHNSICETEAHYTIKAPRTIASLINVRTRVYRGNKQLEQQPSDPLTSSAFVPLGQKKWFQNCHTFIRRIIQKPSLWFGAFVFMCVATVAHLKVMLGQLFGIQTHWEQDSSNRVSTPAIRPQD